MPCRTRRDFHNGLVCLSEVGLNPSYVNPVTQPKQIVKPTLAVEFEGVIHSRSNGFGHGLIYDKPILGSIEALCRLSREFHIVVTTPRDSSQHDQIRHWIQMHQGNSTFQFEVTNRKPIAAYQIVDHAVKFENWDQVLTELGRE